MRHLQTLAWLVVGLIQAECVKLTAWVPFVQGRAHSAQSTQRRFRRWLGKRRLEIAPLYGPLIQQALQEWGAHTVYLALDTSMLWNRSCLVRRSVMYRGRAVPVVWEVREHGSSSVTHAAYEALLEAVPRVVARRGEGGLFGGSGLGRYRALGAFAAVGVAFSHSH